MQRIFILLISFFIFGLPVSACSQAATKKVNTDDVFSLQQNETVLIEDAGIEISMVEIGRQKSSDESGKSVIEITVKHDKKSERITDISQMPFTIGEFELLVWNSDPFQSGTGTFALKQKKNQSVFEFTLKTNETKKLEDLEITLDRVGRKWLANGGGEQTDLRYKVAFNGKINYFDGKSKSSSVGDYLIEVVKADYFGSKGVNFRVSKARKSPIKTAKLGEKFPLMSGDRIAVKDTNFAFTFNNLEYETVRSTDGKEIHYHRLNIEYAGFNINGLVWNNEMRILDFVIYCEPPLDQMPINFIVNKAPKSKDEAARQFVERFGWHLEESVSPNKVLLDFPKDFNGMPFYHYQAASLRSGVDMTGLAGRQVEMLRYTLKEKQTDGKQEYTVFAHLSIENNKVVGAWRTDSSASAPGIYSFEMRKK